MTNTILFVFLGLTQLGFAYYGAFVSVKSLPTEEKKGPHRLIFLLLFILGVTLTISAGLQSSHQQTLAQSQQEDAVRREAKLSNDLNAARRDIALMRGQLMGLGVSVGKIGEQVGDNSSFIRLATAISNLSRSRSADPTGLYDVSINGVPHQRIKIDHKIAPY